MHAISQQTEPVTKIFGRLTVTAQITVDGAYSISTFTGPIREDVLCFATKDRDLFRRVYAVIGEGGNNKVEPAGINAAIRDELTRDLHAALRRPNGEQRADLLDAALNRLTPPAEAEADRQALAGIADNIRHAPRNFRELRDGYANAAARDRTARKAVAR